MKIRIEPHTLVRALERGANEAEIINVLESGEEIPAKNDKFAKFKVFDFMNYRNNKYYEQKRIEVIYTIETNEIVTITVYVFYGKWN